MGGGSSRKTFQKSCRIYDQSTESVQGMQVCIGSLYSVPAPHISPVYK